MGRTIMQMAVEFTRRQMELSLCNRPGLVGYECLPRRTGDKVSAEKAFRGFYAQGAADALAEIEDIISGAGGTQEAVRLITSRIESLRRIPSRDRNPTFWGGLIPEKNDGQPAGPSK